VTLVTNDPVELDPEIDAELIVGVDDDDDADDLADGFVVEGDDDDDDSMPDGDGDDDAGEGGGDDDEGSTIDVPGAAAEEPDEFEEEIVPVARVVEDEDDAQGRQAGEFICTSCFLVKKVSQMAVRSRKVCRDCA